MAKFKMGTKGTYVREEELPKGFIVSFEVAFTDFAVNGLNNGRGFDFDAESDKILESIKDLGQSFRYLYLPGEGFKLGA